MLWLILVLIPAAALPHDLCEGIDAEDSSLSLLQGTARMEMLKPLRGVKSLAGSSAAETASLSSNSTMVAELQTNEVFNATGSLNETGPAVPKGKSPPLPPLAGFHYPEVPVVGGISHVLRLRHLCAYMMAVLPVCPSLHGFSQLENGGENAAAAKLSEAAAFLCPLDPTLGGERCRLDWTLIIHPDRFPRIIAILVQRYLFFVLLLSLMMLRTWVWGAQAPGQGTAAARRQKEDALGTSCLTGFRAALLFWIFLEHSGIQPTNGGGAFLLLSGCVLSLSRRAQPGSAKEPFQSLPEIIRFWILRYFRLLPSLWFAMASTFANKMSSWTEDPVQWTAQTLTNLVEMPFKHPHTFFFAQEHLPLMDVPWFVTAILVLFLGYPLLEMLILGYGKAPLWRLGAFAVLATAAKIAAGVHGMRMSEYDRSHYELYYERWWTRIPEFVIGMLIPHLENRASPDWLVILADIVAVAWVLFALLAPQTRLTLTAIQMNMQCLLTALVIWGMCFGPRPSLLGKICQSPCMIWAGKYGYGFYLYHIPVLIASGLYSFCEITCEYTFPWPVAACARTVTMPHVARLAAMFCVCFSMAMVSFHLIEEPGSQLGNMLADAVAKPRKSQRQQAGSMEAAPEAALEVAQEAKRSAFS